MVDRGFGVQERQARTERDDGVGNTLQGVDRPNRSSGWAASIACGDSVEGVHHEGANQSSRVGK